MTSFVAYNACSWWGFANVFCRICIRCQGRDQSFWHVWEGSCEGVWAGPWDRHLELRFLIIKCKCDDLPCVLLCFLRPFAGYLCCKPLLREGSGHQTASPAQSSELRRGLCCLCRKPWHHSDRQHM